MFLKFGIFVHVFNVYIQVVYAISFELTFRSTDYLDFFMYIFLMFNMIIFMVYLDMCIFSQFASFIHILEKDSPYRIFVL